MKTPEVIELNFQNIPHTISVILIETQKGLAIIDCGPQSTLPALRAALKTRGYQLKDVKHVLLTHIHLDHGAGAWEFAAHGATVYSHPIGIPHLHEPERLIQSATRIYQDRMQTLWGTIKGIPREQLQPLKDNQIVDLGNVSIQAIETPGHASHHLAYQMGELLFAGDAAGVKLEAIGGIVPPTPPPELNFSDWYTSIDKLKALETSQIYLTHFGLSNLNSNEHLTQFKATLKSLENWMHEHFPFHPDNHQTVLENLTHFYNTLIKNGNKEAYETINPVYMALMGLEKYYKKYIA